MGKLYWQNGKDDTSQDLILSRYPLVKRHIPDLMGKLYTLMFCNFMLPETLLTSAICIEINH